MRSISAWVILNACFVAVNVLGAGILLGLFSLGNALAPSAMDNPWLTYPLGLLGVAATLAVAFRVVRLIESRPRGRGHVRG